MGLTGITGWYKLTPQFKAAMGAIPELAPKYPSLETLLAVRPDFFFAGWNYGMKIGGDVTPQTLAPYGINTLVLSESCVQAGGRGKKADMSLLYNDELKLGKIFLASNNRPRRWWKGGNVGWRTCLSGQRIHRRSGSLSMTPARISPFTSGKYGMPTAIIEAAGGRNVMDTLDANWTTTSWEAVAASEPQVIILLDYQTGTGTAALQRVLESHPLMKQTPAVRQQRYLKLQYAELTPGPANIAAVEKLAHLLYATDVK